VELFGRLLAVFPNKEIVMNQSLRLAVYGAGLGILGGLVLLLFSLLSHRDGPNPAGTAIMVQQGSPVQPSPGKSTHPSDDVPSAADKGESASLSIVDMLVSVAVFQANHGRFKEAEDTLERIDAEDKDHVYISFLNSLVSARSNPLNKANNPMDNAKFLDDTTRIAAQIKSPEAKARVLMRLATSSFAGEHAPDLIDKAKVAALAAAEAQTKRQEAQRIEHAVRKKERDAKDKENNDVLQKEIAIEKDRRKKRMELEDIRAEADRLAETKRLTELKKEETKPWFWALLFPTLAGLGAVVTVGGKSAIEEIGKQVVEHYFSNRDSSKASKTDQGE
jgi:hypothetical protein